jgi:hypothetical protein
MLLTAVAHWMLQPLLLLPLIPEVLLPRHYLLPQQM